MVGILNSCLVSVIVPVYKVEKYLDRCVESIVNQTYENLEIILVDDGSPDNCPQICDVWAERDGRIKVIHKENGGLADARNAGMRIATGEYISFIDSDDWIDSNWIEVLLDTAINKECDIAISATRLFRSDDSTILIRGSWTGCCTNIEAVTNLIEEKKIFPTACDKLYKRELIVGYPFKVGKINEDEFWSWHILFVASKVVCCGKPNYNYFQNSESIMGSNYSIKRLDGLDARLERYLMLKNVNYLCDLCNQKLVWDCMYHMQCSCAFLKEPEKNVAIEHIKNVIAEIDYKKIKFKSLKEFVWIALFRIVPTMTVTIRNKLGVGL